MYTENKAWKRIVQRRVGFFFGQEQLPDIKRRRNTPFIFAIQVYLYVDKAGSDLPSRFETYVYHLEKITASVFC